MEQTLGSHKEGQQETFSRAERLPYERTGRLGLFVCLRRRQEEGAEGYKSWQAANKLNMELLVRHTQRGLGSSQWDQEEVGLK